MESFWKALLVWVEDGRIGFSATFPQLDGMP